MKLDLSVTGDIVTAMRAEILAGEKAVTVAMRAAGSGLKSDWRTQITRARLGQRLANTIRSKTYPAAGESLEAAAVVWSNAPQIIGAHDTGPLIRSKKNSGSPYPHLRRAKARAARRSHLANGNDGAACGFGSSIAETAPASLWQRGG